MKLSTLFSTYELATADRELIADERRPYYKQSNIGSAKDELARLWQRRNRQVNRLSEAIEERIADIEEADGVPTTATRSNCQEKRGDYAEALEREGEG